MFKRILVAYDGSKPAEKAFHTALDLAGKYQASLYVLALVQPPDDFTAELEMMFSQMSTSGYVDDVETEAKLQRVREHYEQRFMVLRERAMQAGIVPQFDVLFGPPAERIVIQADEKVADLIIVGHRGTGLFERWLLGSVAKAVMAHAKCTVLVVR